MSSLPLPIAAFFAGLISFLSPCVLPLVPGYVSLISGAGLDELKSPQGQLMRRVLVNSVGFILGFSVVFVTLGAISTEIGQLAARYKHTLSIVAGVVMAYTGFSSATMAINMPASIIILAWMFALGIMMWRRSGLDRR